MKLPVELHNKRRRLVSQTSFFVPLILLALTCLQPASAQIESAELESAIAAIRQVDSGGQGHEPAMAAMQTLRRATPDQIPQMLQGMDGANNLAVNWLRGAIQSALDNQTEWPQAAIRKFLDDRQQCSKGRLMAYELLLQKNPELASQLLPEMIDDPGLELRQKSIAWFIERAVEAGQPEDVYLLGRALANARDVNQIQKIADMMQEHGVNINLQKQLGVINTWHIVGAFDNREEKGFDKPLGPELDLSEIDVTASYDDTLDEQPASWKKHSTVDVTGVVDLNELLGKIKGATAYAYTEFNAEEGADCEIRIGCINANKVWLNGEEIIKNEIYHVGMMPDQFSGKGKLVAGKNRILFKVSQNEQEQPWAQDWMFQLRICTPDGAAIQPKAEDSRQQ